jgi:hypothetical protein
MQLGQEKVALLKQIFEISKSANIDGRVKGEKFGIPNLR